MLSAPIKDGKAVLEELTGQRKEEAEDDDMDWDEEVLGEMEGGYDNRRFSSYWNSDNDMTYPLILAKIPVKNPWELFAWLPFGNWNECPDTPELMAVAKYWFEQHGAVPAAMSWNSCSRPLFPRRRPWRSPQSSTVSARTSWIKNRMTPLWAIWRMS